MIVVISNRNQRGKLDGKPKPFSFLGKDMGEDGNIYARVTSNNTRLKLFAEQDKDELFDDIAARIRQGDAKLNRPWVVFLHGNNQTTAKNIGKAIDIEKRHDVNVIAFSWPSQPYTGDDDKLLKAVKKEAIKKLIRSAGGNVVVEHAISKVSEFVETSWRNYAQARANAEASAGDFSHALRVIKQQFVQQVPARIKLSFICHSLGNYLLQNTLMEASFPLRFSNIMLHQADADAVGHEVWVNKLKNKADHIIITANQYDWVLLTSFYFNRRERLGQTREYHRCHSKKCSYVDFSDAAHTSAENEHEFFRLHHRSNRGLYKEYTNESIYGLCDDIYHSKRPRLSRAAGFCNIRKNLYALQEYIDPVDDVIEERC